MLDKIVFRQSRFFFYFFFLQHVSLTLFHLICSRRFWKVLLSTDSWWSFKELCFRKDIHLVFSITCRTSVKDAGFILILAAVGIR